MPAGLPAGSDVAPLAADAGAAAAPEPVAFRYLATLGAQGIQLVAAAVMAAIVPRALGPMAYGNYSYLLTTAGTLRAFTEPSAQQAFFTFSSQDQRSGPLTKLYAIWVTAQLGLLLGLVMLASATGLQQWVWPGQHVDQIVWVTVLDWLLFLGVSLRQLGDSKGLSVRPQAIGAAVSAMTVVGILVLAATRRLDFASFVRLNVVAAAFACVATGGWLLGRHAGLMWNGALRGRVRSILSRWWTYAVPLIALEYYTPLAAFASTYFVQAWYGSVEQGHLALAMRWSALVLVFTTAATTIVWREVAAAFARGDRDTAAQVYARFNRVLVFMAATLSIWLSVASRALVVGVAGPAYRASVPILAIMAFYPLAQTHAQLSSAAMKAVERTAAYRNWTVFISVPDLLLTYLLVAPRDAAIPGLGLGAVGVALKMAAFSLVTVQVYDWSMFRFFGLRYDVAIGQKLAMIVVVGACAGAALYAGGRALEASARLSPLAALAVTSPVYFAVVALVAIRWPALVGISAADVDAVRRLTAGVLSRS